MHVLRNLPLLAALALCALPVASLCGEAPAASPPSQQDTEKKLAAARQRLDEAAREVGELSAQLGRRFNMQFAADAGERGTPRALLGVVISPDARKEGAHVRDLSPGGPAAEAGIRAGDVITGIGDMDLTRDSNPGRALVEKVAQLEPDRQVKIAVLRDGRKLSFDVTPRPAPGNNVGMRGMQGMPGMPGAPGTRSFGTARLAEGPLIRDGQGRDARELLSRMQQQLAEAGAGRGDDSAMRFGGAELAALSERLGGYFGVKAGVLVVRAGVNSPFRLQDGDVILAIDGREVTNAQQAARILRSYQPGEKLTLRVQRDRKPQSIDVAAPDNRRN